MILIPAHATRTRTPISTKNTYITGFFLIASVISTPILYKLLNPSQSGVVLSKSTDTSTTRRELTESNNNTPWIIELDETGILNKTKTNGIRHHSDGYWYPTRKGEAGFIYIEIPANFEEMHIEFQVIDEAGNSSELDPSFIWKLTKLNPNIDSKKQQELVELFSPEYAVHTRSDGTKTKTLENIGIAINSDLETSISAKRQNSQELPHPVMLNQSNNVSFTRTSSNGNEGIYNIHFDFTEKNENGRNIPMKKEFPVTIPMPYTPLNTTEGKVNLNLGAFFGHGIKITSLKVR